jgi:uncharacterized protein YndB with AHSA1/START domain
MPVANQLIAVLSLFTASSAANATQRSLVADTSHVAPDGERVLQQHIEIDAPVEEVWQAFTTTAGFRSWAAPVAVVDFRLGGVIEAAYDPQGRIGAPGNIKNQIVAYVPQRMLALRNVQAPPKLPFDAATFQKIHTVNFFEPITKNRTRITVSQPGFGEGPVYDGVYKFFAAGNRWSLEQLKKTLEAKLPAK